MLSTLWKDVPPITGKTDHSGWPHLPWVVHDLWFWPLRLRKPPLNEKMCFFMCENDPSFDLNHVLHLCSTCWLLCILVRWSNQSTIDRKQHALACWRSLYSCASHILQHQNAFRSWGFLVGKNGGGRCKRGIQWSPFPGRASIGHWLGFNDCQSEPRSDWLDQL